MRKRHLIAVLAVAIAMPLAVAHGDTSPSGADCGSKPTPPARPAAGTQPTADIRTQMQQFIQQMQTYDKCMGITPGKLDAGGLHNGQGTDATATTQDRCTLINQRITDRLNNFQSKQNSDTTIFGNVYERLINISTRLKGDNLDTTKLNTDLATLKTKIDKVNADYASFITGLKATVGLTCGQSQGQFMGKLGAARGILLSVRQDRLDVRSYIVSTIIPDIKTLRQQLAKTESTTNTTATTTTINTNNQ